VVGSRQPGDFDAVLGGQSPSPIGAAVLGGLDGLKRRFNSDSVDQRIAAVRDSVTYGQTGLDLLINALQDESIQVQRVAYLLLCDRQELSVRQALRAYDVYPIFECLGVLRGHAGGVTAVALSLDGTTIISAGRDATLRVWDLPTQEEVMQINCPKFVYAIAISPDARTFTLRYQNQAIEAWDLRFGQPIEADDLPTRTIASVAVSPTRQRTAKHLISGSQNLIRVWNLKTGREVRVLQGHTSLVTSVAVAPNRSLLVSGSEDRTVRIWGAG
jgi:WD40 repeat protein